MINSGIWTDKNISHENNVILLCMFAPAYSSNGEINVRVFFAIKIALEMPRPHSLWK